MLIKVLKKMREEQKKTGEKKDLPVENTKTYPTSTLQKRSGFHAKANSQEGAERQRSMGNRMSKPAR